MAASGNISIVPSGLIGRAFDPQPEAGCKHQVRVIITDLKTADETEQNRGRSERISPKTGERRKGRTAGVYNLAKLFQSYPELIQYRNDAFIHTERFKQRVYMAYYERQSVLRLQRQVEGEALAVLQEHFFQFWQPLLKTFASSNADRNHQELKSVLLNVYTELLLKLSELRPPQVSNKKALDDFNKDIIKMWDGCLSTFSKTLVQFNMHFPVSDQRLEIEQAELQKRQERIQTAHACGDKAGKVELGYKVHDKWQFMPMVEAHLALREPQKKMRTIVESPKSRVNLTHAKLYLKNQLQLQCIYDPLQTGYQLIMTATNAFELKSMQDHLIAVLTKMAYKGVLHFKVSGQNNIVVKVDFNHSDFDACNRCQLLLNLMDGLELEHNLLRRMRQVINSTQSYPVPSVTAMKQLALDFQIDNDNSDQVTKQQLDEIQAIIIRSKYQKIFDQTQLFEKLLKPIIHFARTRPKGFFAEQQLLLEALSSYHIGFEYVDKKGKRLVTLPPSFSNLQELIDNHIKREMLKNLYKEMHTLSKSTEALDKAKFSCLRLLVNTIVQSKPAESFATLYQQWASTNFQYKNSNTTYRQLMSFQVASNFYFRTAVASSETLCLRADEQVQKVKTRSQIFE